MVSATQQSTDENTGHKKHKRKKTGGEIAFNFGVYGGISWILNEIISTIITNTIYFADPAEKAARTEKIAEQVVKGLAQGEKQLKPVKDGVFARFFNNTVDGMHTRVNPMKWAKTPFYLAAEMFVMCIGGTLLVIPTKLIEDSKGKIVRGIDSFFHGGKQDPKLEAAHKEMDNAPQQSWGSLWKGRLLVLASAITLHFVAGAEKTTPPHGTQGVQPYTAPSTKWLKGTFLEKYSNLSRVMKTGSRDLFSLKWMPFISAEHKAAMREARMLPGVPAIDLLKEGKIAHAMGNTFGYVLSVSAAMATLFYISSHIFAAARDKKKEVQQPKNDEVTISSSSKIALPDDNKEPKDNQPHPTVSHITREAHIANVAQVGQLGAN